jgi:hypothetical protein
MRIRHARAIAFTAAVAIITALTQLWFGDPRPDGRQAS